MTERASALFDPIRIGPLELRNRTLRAAAFEGMCPAGVPSQSLVDCHGEIAAGQAAMTTVAYASVTATGRTFAHQLWLRPSVVPALRKVTDAIHAHGAAASIQIGHAGYMADRAVTGQRSIAPSAVLNVYGLALPRAMTLAELEAMPKHFAAAAKLCVEAGFDAVEVQAGHGYLLSQFISPYTNRRKDHYGGSLENRARFAKAVIQRVREALGKDKALVVKTNLRDGFAGGMPLQEGVRVAQMLEAWGADLLVLSGGFVSKCPMYVMRGEMPLEPMIENERSRFKRLGLALFGKWLVEQYPFNEAYFLEDALAVRRAVSMPLALVGGLRRRSTLDDVLARGFDIAAMARPFFRDPDFVAKLKAGEAGSVCEPCNHCMATMYHGEAVCPRRDEAE